MVKQYTEEQYEQAKNLIAFRQQASVMMVNRAITKRYIPAAQIIDRLEDEGHIGKYEGNNKPRKVFIKPSIENNLGADI